MKFVISFEIIQSCGTGLANLGRISAWVGKSFKENAQSLYPINHDPVVAPHLIWNLQNF
jgi:hypothetical protein